MRRSWSCVAGAAFITLSAVARAGGAGEGRAVGKLVEKPFTEQAVTYPVPVLVKVPAPPDGIEPERVAVARVVVDYTSPGGQHGQAELKPVKDGYGGEIPCDGVQTAGKLKYFTTALNRFDNPVAIGGTAAAPHTVNLKVAIGGAMPHLPPELPPQTSADGKEAGGQAGK